MTPRLWRKSNLILASMLLSNVISGIIIVFWYNPFILVVYVFDNLYNLCRFNVAVVALTPLMKMTPLVNNAHLILISVEQYIAIVYPLHYESKFTDRTLKWAIFAAWVACIFAGMTYMLWLINADLRRCVLIPVQYHMVDVYAYMLVCASMFVCYGKILAVSQRLRRRSKPEPVTINVATRATSTSLMSSSAHNSKAASGNTNTVDPTDKALPSVEVPPASVELTQEQRLQKIKSRRREFKAVYLTAAIVGTFVILWFPHALGRVLESVSYDPGVTNYIFWATGPVGTANYAFSWVIYAAVSKSYRRAYRQMLNRIGCCCCCCCKNVSLPADNSLVI